MIILEGTEKMVTPIPWYGVVVIGILIFGLLFMLASDWLMDFGIFEVISCAVLTAIIILLISFSPLTKPRKQFYADLSSLSYEEISKYKVVEQIGTSQIFLLEEKVK